MRKTNVPPWCRANAQLKRAVLAMPTCGLPVGDGQKRTRTEDAAGSATLGDAVLTRSEYRQHCWEPVERPRTDLQLVVRGDNTMAQRSHTVHRHFDIVAVG